MRRAKISPAAEPELCLVEGQHLAVDRLARWRPGCRPRSSGRRRPAGPGADRPGRQVGQGGVGEEALEGGQVVLAHVGPREPGQRHDEHPARAPATPRRRCRRAPAGPRRAGTATRHADHAPANSVASARHQGDSPAAFTCGSSARRRPSRSRARSGATAAMTRLKDTTSDSSVRASRATATTVPHRRRGGQHRGHPEGRTEGVGPGVAQHGALPQVAGQQTQPGADDDGRGRPRSPPCRRRPASGTYATRPHLRVRPGARSKRLPMLAARAMSGGVDEDPARAGRRRRRRPGPGRPPRRRPASRTRW